MHLKPEELIDLAEGTRDEASVPHLASCERCRAQLAELRSLMMMATSGGDPVPEPSPIFWDQFQRRVAEAIREQEPRRLPGFSGLAGFGGFSGFGFSRFTRFAVAGAAAIAAIAIAVALNSRSNRVAVPGAPEPQIATVAPVDARGSHTELLNDALAGDPSLQLVADLSETLDVNAASDAGLASEGGAEHAVTHLSSQELTELQRLLRAEMRRSGA